MACSKCNTPNCGCSGTYVVSQTCPPACSEVFNSSCIVYTGVDITCVDPVSGLSSTIISRNDYLDTALTALVNYICARFNPATIPSSVVVSGDSFILVSPNTVGYVTTYTVTLDPTSLPSASIVTGGANAVVTGTGAAADPYVVNANESVVAVDAASALTLVVDPSTPGPYETTYTIGIDASLLPVTELQTSFGHISITEIPNTPNAGDTTYTLEVDEVTITSVDAKIDVVNTAAGGIAPFERTFTVDVNETEMGNYIMDTAAGILAQGGIIADPASAITVGYDALTHTITIGESIGVPLQWKTISDGVTDIVAASANDKIRIVAGTGASVGLASGPGANEATFTVTNTDLGSAQSTYTDFACTNNSGAAGGTCSATSNGQALNLVGGDSCDLSVDPVSNTITIDNTIDKVYASVVGDDGVSLEASGTVDQLDVLGGDRISTSGTAAPGGNELTVTFDGVAITGSGISGNGTTASPLSVTSGGTQVQVVQDLEIDASGNFNVSGATTAVLDFGPTGVTPTISSNYMQVSLIDATPASPTLGQQVAIPGGPFTIQMNVGQGKLALNNVGGATVSKKYTLIATGDAI